MYRLRTYQKNDAANVVTMLNAGRAVPRAVVDGAGNIRLIRYVPASSSKAVVEDPQGQLVGYAYVADKENSFVFETGGGIHPEYQNTAVSSLLIRWAQEESLKLSQNAPKGVRCVLQVNIFETDQETIRQYTEAGFAKVRTWDHYHIHFSDAPPSPNLPENMTIRPFDLDDDADWDLVSPVQDAAFMDHWASYVLPPVESVESQEPENDDEEEIPLDFSFSNAQGYCFIAFMGEEVAGGILCNARLVEFQKTGRVGSVFTNPKFRGQGVGKNLMLTTFNAFYQNGMPRAILDTDSQSFTDSAKFYTSLGMNIYCHEFLYEKEIRPGNEIRRLTRDS